MPYCVYILASRHKGTLDIGVTNDLARRVHEHREGLYPGFTKRYGVARLVHYEPYDDIRFAQQRERNLKRWLRAWKILLIEAHNSSWRDLYEDLQL